MPPCLRPMMVTVTSSCRCLENVIDEQTQVIADTRRGRHPEKISEVMSRLFARKGYAQALTSNDCDEAWREAAGPRFAPVQSPRTPSSRSLGSHCGEFDRVAGTYVSEDRNCLNSWSLYAREYDSRDSI